MPVQKSAVWPRVFAENVKIALGTGLPLAAAYLLAVPLAFSISRLDAQSSAVVLERFAALVGVLLLPPLFLPELGGRNPGLHSLLRSKEFPLGAAFGLRVLSACGAALLLLAAFSAAMTACGSRFPAVEYTAGAFANAVLLGGLGCAGFALTTNIAAGYLLPLAWFVCNLFTSAEQIGIFFLFSLYPSGFGLSKLLQFAMGALLLAFSAYWSQRRLM